MISDTSVSVTSFMDVISSDDSESTAEHKSRFGKPVNVPNLAENIKGISTCFSWNQIMEYLSWAVQPLINLNVSLKEYYSPQPNPKP